jgi:hypothetical protein
MTFEGATKLAAQISSYWQRVDPKNPVSVWVERDEIISERHPDLAKAIYVVRSNLKGGLPDND